MKYILSVYGVLFVPLLMTLGGFEWRLDYNASFSFLFSNIFGAIGYKVGYEISKKKKDV